MKTLVFDADGVLGVGERFDVALEKHDRIPRSRLAPFFAGHFRDCVLGRRDLKDALEHHVAEWGWKRPVDGRCELGITSAAPRHAAVFPETTGTPPGSDKWRQASLPAAENVVCHGSRRSPPLLTTIVGAPVAP